MLNTKYGLTSIKHIRELQLLHLTCLIKHIASITIRYDFDSIVVFQTPSQHLRGIAVRISLEDERRNKSMEPAVSRHLPFRSFFSLKHVTDISRMNHLHSRFGHAATQTIKTQTVSFLFCVLCFVSDERDEQKGGGGPRNHPPPTTPRTTPLPSHALIRSN